jgi:hypothetical protein
MKVCKETIYKEFQYNPGEFLGKLGLSGTIEHLDHWDCDSNTIHLNVVTDTVTSPGVTTTLIRRIEYTPRALAEHLSLWGKVYNATYNAITREGPVTVKSKEEIKETD